MGIFKKKRQIQPMEQPVMPVFPDIPENDMNSDDNEFSTYEPTIADIKNQVSGDENFAIPERKRPILRPSINKNDFKFEENSPSEQSFSFDEEKPIFVRMDNYKEALKHLKNLKEKIEDAQNVLAELDSIREEEEIKIEEWRKELQNIKEKMLSIDKHLFEV
ncbi:hypothetical protein J4440_01360 [Candidatus Woesearchaeota archaeon]|nr:hypothetical protein [Candidatus Woesearchaeota archaeon]